MTAEDTPIGLPDTFYLRTFGCQMNEHDSERIAGQLVAMGMRRVDRAAGADVLVYNTCSIREKADTRLLGHLGEAAKLKRHGDAELVVVAGCLAQSRREAFLDEHRYIDVLVGPQSVHELPDLIIDRLRQGAPATAFAEKTERFSAELPRSRRDGPLAWVQIMTGCTNYCSYCIVPYVRGPEASRPSGAVVEEIRALTGKSVREVTLLGQNVNAYGLDGHGVGGGNAGREDFAGLLYRIANDTEVDRLRFMTSHPKDVSERLISAMAEIDQLCEHLHLPVQSGSDRILGAMRRGYGRDDYRRLVARLREAVPGLALTTDLIVGFPGETEDDFQDTLDLVEEVGYDAAFTFLYSARTGTRAAAMPGRIPADAAEDRMSRLVEAVRQHGLERNRALVGTVQEVLVEGPSRNRPDELAGRTRTYKTINLAAPKRAPRPGDIVDARVDGATSASLRGVLVHDDAVGEDTADDDSVEEESAA